MDKTLLLRNGLSLEHNEEFLKGLAIAVKTPGPIFDIGCWTGTISFLAAAWLLENNINKTIYLFDTFKGHPESSRTEADNSWNFDIACFKNTSIEAIGETFASIGFNNYEIVGGNIDETLRYCGIIPCFASIDLNYYLPTKVALDYLSTFHHKNTIIWEDDRNNIAGIDKAYNERTDLERLDLGQTRGDFFKFK